jgi:hypothetical protein
MELGPRSRIVTADRVLLPLAGILAEEVYALTGKRLPAEEGKAGPGDVVLAVDAALQGETYKVEVDDRAAVHGGNYGAVALGTATLLQAIQVQDCKAMLCGMAVTDEPAVAYRGLLVDVARQYHSITSLKQIVELCRLYKIRYLQLHLTDDQSFMFPSNAYPQLATKNEHGGKTYTLAGPCRARCRPFRPRLVSRNFMGRKDTDATPKTRSTPPWADPIPGNLLGSLTKPEAGATILSIGLPRWGSAGRDERTDSVNAYSKCCHRGTAGHDESRRKPSHCNFFLPLRSTRHESKIPAASRRPVDPDLGISHRGRGHRQDRAGQCGQSGREGQDHPRTIQVRERVAAQGQRRVGRLQDAF